MPSHDPAQETARITGARPATAANLKQLLLARADWFERELLAGISTGDYAFLSPAQTRLLAHMGGRPMSMSELGRRLAISRQAVHRTVTELVRRGLLEVREDPERGNARLVVYTEKGRQVNRSGARLIERIEGRIAQRIGADGLATLKRLLGEAWD